VSCVSSLSEVFSTYIKLARNVGEDTNILAMTGDAMVRILHSIVHLLTVGGDATVGGEGGGVCVWKIDPSLDDRPNQQSHREKQRAPHEAEQQLQQEGK